MNDQSPPPNWFLRPQSGPYWMPNAVWNGGLTPPAKDRFDPSTWTPSTWDPSTWNPDRFSSSEDAIRNYKRLAGEAEARNAEKRLRWSEERRRAEPFPETEYPPRDQQIIR
jgi:hypothetical protein